MTPLALTIFGFRSFLKRQTLTFPQAPGLYRVLGVNEQEPRLGSNGSGKSSTFDALSWCLHGKTARGLKKVTNWKADEADVTFEATDPDVQIRRRGNKLFIDGKPAEQQAVDDLLGCGHATFLATVLLGQFNPLFLDLPPAAKMQALEEVLDLEVWRRAAAWAGVAVRGAEEAEGQLREQRARLEGQRKALAAQVEDLTARHDAWEEDRGRDAREVAGKVEAADGELAKAEREYQIRIREATAADAEEDSCRRQLLEDDERLRVAEKAGARESEVLAAVEADLRHAEELWAATRDGKCGACGQPLPRYKKSAVLNKVTKARQDRDECQERLQRAFEAVTAAEDARKAAEAAFVRAEKKARDAGAAKATAGAALQRARAAVKVVGERATRVAEAGNPHKAPLAAARAALRRCEEDGKAVAAQMAQAAVRREAAGYWPRGFKELRLWLADEAVTQLEVEVNNSLLELGLEGWSVKCALERETTQGTVSKGFTVEVEAPGGRKAPWEAWCGGETQRLRVAGALGLAGLARARLGVTLNLEVWDEPSQHLGKEGVRDLLEYFAQRAQAEGRVIYYIDHRASNEGAFDGTVVVRKGTKGSVVE